MQLNSNMFLPQQYAAAVKQFWFQVLKDKYPQCESMIDRICTLVQTPKDFEDISALLTLTYEEGFKESVRQHAEILRQHGLSVSIKNPEPPKGKSIFNR